MFFLRISYHLSSGEKTVSNELPGSQDDLIVLLIRHALLLFPWMIGIFNSIL